MAEISAQLVKKLREMTDAGMMECKKALVETNGNLDEAVDWLRKKGLSKAAKKADRVASEGSVALKVSDDFKKGVLVEINCETDFVSQNDNFKEFVNKSLNQVFEKNSQTVEELLKSQIDGVSFEEYLQNTIAKIGENIVIRRLINIELDQDALLNGYVHSNGKVGVIVAAKTDTSNNQVIIDALKEIAMHAAAMKPKYLNEAEVSPQDLEKEKEIAIEQLKKEGKPENMIEKILPGKIKKFYEECTLINQKFVKDDKKSVGEYLNSVAKSINAKVELIKYVRFELGEGIEKKACDFASEVAAALK